MASQYFPAECAQKKAASAAVIQNRRWICAATRRLGDFLVTTIWGRSVSNLKTTEASTAPLLLVGAGC
jgi:hypothetical protein